jgi:hypothetical protein
MNIHIERAISDINNGRNFPHKHLKKAFEEDFDGSLDFFVKIDEANSLSRGQKFKLTQSFWKSKISNKLSLPKDRILASEYFTNAEALPDFLNFYLSQSDHIDEELLLKAIGLDSDATALCIKRNKIFIKDDLDWDSIRDKVSLHTADPTFPKFVRECEILGELYRQVKAEASEFDYVLKALEITELLGGLSLYYEEKRLEILHWIYQGDGIFNHYENNVGCTETESLLSAFDRIIKAKIRLGNSNSIIEIPFEKSLFDELIGAYRKLVLFEQEIGFYCYHDHWSLAEERENGYVFQNTKLEHSKIWGRINYKFMIQHTFYYNYVNFSGLLEPIMESDMNDIDRFASFKALLFRADFFSRFQLPDIIQNQDGKSIDLHKALTLLGRMAGYSYKRYEEIVNAVCLEFAMGGFEFDLEKILAEATIRLKSMAPWHPGAMPLVSQEERSFVTQLCKSLESGESGRDEILGILDLISSDLDGRDTKKIDLVSKPFIKIGGDYVWLASALAERNQAISLYNCLYQGRLLENEHKKQSEETEKELAGLFKHAGFSALNSREFKDGKLEVDVLAYDEKDKVLFVIEHKNSLYVRSAIHEIQSHKAVSLEKGAKQLGKALTYIEKHFDEIKSLLNIKEDFEAIRLYPLLTTNSFEEDYIGVNGFKKISMFELRIILENSKSFLFNPIEMLPPDLRPYTSYPPDECPEEARAIQECLQLFREECNLWENPEQCNANSVISAIEEDKVWDFLNDQDCEPQDLIFEINGKIITFRFSSE